MIDDLRQPGSLASKPYDPALPVTVRLMNDRGTGYLSIKAGCELSTLIKALQLYGMAKPDG